MDIDIAQVVPEMGAVSDVLDLIMIAEDEIAEAMDRHPNEADALWHCFALLRTSEMRGKLSHAAVYRAHCRQLLERVARDEDLTRATDVEICRGLATASFSAPLDDAATGLYMCLWTRAGLPDDDGTIADLATYHEKTQLKDSMRDYEERLRWKLAEPTRVLGDITCGGRHHGEDVDCRYAIDTTDAD